MLIVPGPASVELARKVSEALGTPLVSPESKIFPDGDTYFRFSEQVRGEDVAVIQSTYPSQDQKLIQLFLLIDGLRDLGCDRIYAVAPYLAYMRQDKRFLKGEIVTAGTILNIVKNLHVEKLFTIDIHNPEILMALDQFAIDLTATPVIISWIRSRNWQHPLIVAPDKGAARRVSIVGSALDTNYIVGRKTRDRKTGEVNVEFDKDLKVNGRIAVIVDETIARGDTVIKSAEILLRQGAERVVAACTHGLFLENAAERIESSGVSEIVSTDTIPSPKSGISVAPIIASALQPKAKRKAQT